MSSADGTVSPTRPPSPLHVRAQISKGWLLNIPDEAEALARRAEFSKVNWKCVCASRRLGCRLGPCVYSGMGLRELPAFLSRLCHVTVLSLECVLGRGFVITARVMIGTRVQRQCARGRAGRAGRVGPVVRAAPGVCVHVGNVNTPTRMDGRSNRLSSLPAWLWSRADLIRLDLECVALLRWWFHFCRQRAAQKQRPFDAARGAR